MPVGILFTTDEKMFACASHRCWAIVQVHFPYVHLTQFIYAVRYTKTGGSGYGRPEIFGKCCSATDGSHPLDDGEGIAVVRGSSRGVERRRSLHPLVAIRRRDIGARVHCRTGHRLPDRRPRSQVEDAWLL